MAKKVSIGTGIALTLTLVGGTALAAQNRGPTDSFDFAEKQMGQWQLKATTHLYRSDRVEKEWSPTVTGVTCDGEAPQGSFKVDGGMISALRMRFLGSPDKRGNRDEITLLGDHLWLYIDGDRWEFANIPIHSPNFSNGNYPATGPDEVVIADWRGYQAVRKTEKDPWLAINMIYERLMDAKKLEWGFKSREWTVVDKSVSANRLPAHWETTRYPINNRDLKKAIFWCARQISSDNAYTLPDRLK